jgi:hypothetical protein
MFLYPALAAMFGGTGWDVAAAFAVAVAAGLLAIQVPRFAVTCWREAWIQFAPADEAVAWREYRASSGYSCRLVGELKVTADPAARAHLIDLWSGAEQDRATAMLRFPRWMGDMTGTAAEVRASAGLLAVAAGAERAFAMGRTGIAFIPAGTTGRLRWADLTAEQDWRKRKAILTGIAEQTAVRLTGLGMHGHLAVGVLYVLASTIEHAASSAAAAMSPSLATAATRGLGGGRNDS